MDLSQIVPYILTHAQWIGLALLGAGILVRIFGRALSRVLFVSGVLAVAAFAYQEWQAVHNLLLAGGILLAGVVVFGLLAWTIRGISFVFAFVLLAAAFYLIVYGWMGPSFAGTAIGSLTWAGATILTMVVTGIRGASLRRTPTTVAGAGAAL